MACQFLYVCGSGQLSGSLHPVDSRMQCLPQADVIRIVFFRAKGSLVQRKQSKIYLGFE